MDNERIRDLCLTFPHVAETLNWGSNLVYWAAPRELGGKIFAITDLEPGRCVLAFHAGQEHFYELLEVEGIVPAPHLARAFWVGLERWDALRPHQIEEELRRAYELVFARLPKKTRTLLALPEKERAKLIRERKQELAAQAEKPAKTSVRKR